MSSKYEKVEHDSTSDSNDLFGNTTFASEVNYRSKIVDSSSDDDLLIRKKVTKPLSDSSYTSEVDGNDESKERCSVDNSGFNSHDPLYENYLKEYVFGDVNNRKSSSVRHSNEKVKIIDESNDSIDSIINSSDDGFLSPDKHSTLLSNGRLDSVKKVLIKNWLRNVSLQYPDRIYSEKSVLSDKKKVNHFKDDFNKVLNETTNTIESLCVTPKTVQLDKVGKLHKDNQTPKKKLYSRNDGSFDDKENILDIKSVPEPLIREPSVGKNFLKSSDSLESSKQASNSFEPQVNTASPLIRNESKRRKVNKGSVIASEFKFDEYVNSPIHKNRDFENHFTDSEVERSNKSDKKAEGLQNIGKDFLGKNRTNTNDGSFNKEIYKEISERNPLNYFTDTDVESDDTDDKNTEDLHMSIGNVTLAKDADNFSDTDDSFSKILSKKKIGRNPLNYSDESNSPENSIPGIIQDIPGQENGTVNDFSKTKNVTVHNSISINQSKTSRNSDLISSIFLDESVTASSSVNIKTEKVSESNLGLDDATKIRTQHEIITISDSSDEEIGKGSNFHGDSFDQDEYFRKIREETRSTPVVKKNSSKLEQIISTVSVPLFSSDELHTSFLLSLNNDVEKFMCHPEAMKYKTSFQMYKDELIAILFKIYNKDIFDNKLPIIEISWSGHLTTTSGITKSSSKINREGKKERKSCIKLSKSIIKDAAKLRDVLLHEMCHVANWMIDEHSDRHGPLFRKWANKALHRFPEIPKVTVCHRYELNYKYKYRCTYCGYEVGRMKLVVKDYVCKLCGGTVTVDY